MLLIKALVLKEDTQHKGSFKQVYGSPEGFL